MIPGITLLVLFLTHPLDGLSGAEIKTAVDVLRENNRLGHTARVAEVALHPPEKSLVLSGDTPPRRARVVALEGGQGFYGVVELATRRVLSWELTPGQPGLLPAEEWEAAGNLVRADERWRRAIARRGIHDPDEVVCIPYTTGSPVRDGRLVFVVAFHGAGAENFWGRPLEGLLATVDLTRREVVRVSDPAPIPVSRSPVDFHRRIGVRPPSLTAPDSLIERSEGEIRWQRWRFRLRFDPRVGPVVCDVRWAGDDGERSILYEGHLSELFVPYMDPDPAWSFRAFLDAGEYGIGRLSVPLVAGADCPPNAHLLHVEFAGEDGTPYLVPRAMGVFTRNTGDVEWRHFESVTGRNETRPQQVLVVRSVVALGNYDYVLDWTFRRDGSIAVTVASSGVALVKGVVPGGDPGPFARKVAPDLAGVHHDHWFNFRLDLDVDGTDNHLVVDRLERRRHVRGARSGWALNSRMAVREQEAQLQMDLRRPALWRVVSAQAGQTGGPPGSTPVAGRTPSYQLKPGVNAAPLWGNSDPLRARAGFISHHLWVTPYAQEERYAAGRFPWGSPGDGLPRWTAANRVIENTDLVLWYTFGFHHTVRGEDWPVMPAVHAGFELRPFDFFERNPALEPGSRQPH